MNKGVDMGIEVRNKKERFIQLFKEQVKTDKLQLIGEEVVPYVYIDAKDSQNEALVEYLKNKGFFATTMKHLKEDWNVKNNYVRITFNKKLDDDNMNKLVEALAQY